MQEPIKVAFFLPLFAPGGIERIVLNLLRHLDRARFAPILLLARRAGDLLADLPADVPVMDLGGARMRQLPLRLTRSLREIAPNVVYSGTNAANIALLTARLMMPSPPRIMVSEHTPPSLFLDEAKWPAIRPHLMRHLYRRADMVAVPLLDIGLELRARLALPRLRIREFANPVLADDAVGRSYGRPALPGLRPDVPFFVAAGRLAPEKGYDLLLRAFAGLPPGREQVHLVILGEGPERARLEALAAELGLGARVQLPGYTDEPARVFHHAAALVVSSRREGTPNVIVEAMAAGTPVIATRCSYGPQRLLHDGEAGLLVPPHETAGLTAAMAQVLTEPRVAEELRQAGLRQATRFTIGRTVPDFEHAFHDLARA